MNHVESTIVQLSSDSPKELIKGQLAVLVGIEVLNDLSDLDLRQVKTIVSHGVLELNGAQGVVAISVHGFEHSAQASESIGTSNFAQLNNFLANLFEVRDLNVFLHVWVSDVQVTAGSSSEIGHCLLLSKVNIALVANNRLGLVERLSHATCPGKWIWPCGGTHVEILPLESLSVDSDWSLLSVVTLWDPLSQLIISHLGGSAVHSRLNLQSLVTGP